MADEAIQYMKQLKEIAPDKPFFVYYVPGGTHAPHHPTPEWIKKISDMHLFDEGWNKLRETIFANQKRLGIMPANAQLTPWPKELPEWDTLDGTRRSSSSSRPDVYAAYLAYTDHEIGRVIQAVEDLGELDNTLIIYISGDNGASAEGMLNGTPNEFTTFNGVPVPVKDQFLWYEFWGSDETFPHLAAAGRGRWTRRSSGSSRWPSHFGGTAQGMAMSWPGHINDVGGIRRQFHHVIDIVPTILEATGIPAPDDQRHQAAPDRRREHGLHLGQGERQRPVHAHHAVLRDARQPRHLSRRLGGGDDAGDLPWALSTATPPDVITGYKWELYNVKEDPTQFNDLAAKMPDKLKQMQDLFYAEAKKYNVLPLDNSTLARWNTPRPSLTAGRTVFTYSGELTGVPASAAPSILDKSYTITAEVEIPEGGAEGMIVTEGGRFGGYGLFLSKGEFGIRPGQGGVPLQPARPQAHDVGGPELNAGKHTIVFDFKSDGPGLGKGGTGVLSVDGKEVARNSMEHTTPITFPEDETFDIGQDTRTPVAMLEYRYDVPFKFTGKIGGIPLRWPGVAGARCPDTPAGRAVGAKDRQRP